MVTSVNKSKEAILPAGHKRSLGFTLVELLVVITIIGLLAGAVLIGTEGMRRSGRDARRIADLRTISTALELYFTQNNRYPGSPAFAVPSSWTHPAPTTLSLPQRLIAAGIGITRVPVDPSPGRANPYMYSSASPWMNYVLRASLETPGHHALANDLDGTVFGVPCDDISPGHFYCIGL